MGLKELARTPGPKIGNFIVEFATPGIGHILKAAGLDFAFFDMEHSGFSFETLKSAVRYFEAAQVPLIVRVPAQENDMLARACDMGAEGLIAPMISTKAQAQAMVNSVKYFPAGKRGVGLQMAHDNYRAAPVADALNAANDRTSVICLIETAEGAENVDAIAGVRVSTACGSATSTCRSRSAFRASSTIRNSPPPSTAPSRPRRSTASSSAGLCRAPRPASPSTSRASTSSAIRATSGCCATGLPPRARPIREGVRS